MPNQTICFTSVSSSIYELGWVEVGTKMAGQQIALLIMITHVLFDSHMNRSPLCSVLIGPDCI